MTNSSVFQLIDLDRTLFDTSKFVKALTDEIDIIQPGVGAEFDRRFEEAYEKEETFFLMRFLRREKGDVWFESLVRTVVAKHGAEAFLIEGARERLAFADSFSAASPAWGILTYGDKVDQLMKLRICGLENAPVSFMRTPNKGEVIQSWKTANGKFQLPTEYGGGVVDTLVLEDDKLRAVLGLPTGTYGLWIAAPGKVDHGKGIKLPENVVAVQNLFESIEFLKTKFIK